MAWRFRLAPIGLAALAVAAMESPTAFVPWKVVGPDDAPAKASLVLYWIPVSADEFKHSALLTSRQLTVYASQCIAMQVIRSDDAAKIEKLHATGELPTAILLRVDQVELARVRNDRGILSAAAVEKMVRDALRTRETEVEGQLDDAARKLDRGERDAAVSLYREVYEQRCLFPRAGRQAQRALKRLGIE
jgi:hypothetical protein